MPTWGISDASRSPTHGLFVVFPALLLNYLGSVPRCCSTQPEAAAENPFFLMAPEEWRLPLVILATLATIIASQAVITGAFSVVPAGCAARPHAASQDRAYQRESALGQIYVPDR